jgi:hypothetical protein
VESSPYNQRVKFPFQHNFLLRLTIPLFQVKYFLQKKQLLKKRGNAMELWNIWMSLVNQFESACSRKATFFWLVIVLIGFTIKFDAIGVTSLARGVGLAPHFYSSLLHFFNSTGIKLESLQSAWIKIVFEKFNALVMLNGRCLILADGIKIGKEGRKMPAVKWLHQDSETNSKAPYIMGHSIQVVSILANGLSTFFSVPLTARIHEGIRLTYKDTRTLLDKMFGMLAELQLPTPFYLIADKYYCSGRFMKLLINSGAHMITMMKKNAVAYRAPEFKSTGRGRPKKYGERVKLFDLFKTDLIFSQIPMPGNKKIMIEYCAVSLLWKPLGDFVKFVLVRHPIKGNAICMTTDLSLDAMDIIFGYSLRFKIEVMFKQAVHQISAFMYRFWLKSMLPRKRGSGDCMLQFESSEFKKKMLDKLNAYHLFIQLGLIAQGLMQYLAIHHYGLVWKKFSTWLRTIRENTLPSEKVVSLTLSKTYIEFLIYGAIPPIFKKFLREKIDASMLQQGIFEQKNAA